MPNHVYNIVTATGDDQIVQLLDQAVHADEDRLFDFNRIVPKLPIVDIVYPDLLCAATKDAHPNRNWYAWQIRHWGTKSNSYWFEDSEPGLYRFCTAWSPPLPVVRVLSELFPELEITLDYEEGGEGLCGETTFRDGRIVSEESQS